MHAISNTISVEHFRTCAFSISQLHSLLQFVMPFWLCYLFSFVYFFPSDIILYGKEQYSQDTNNFHPNILRIDSVIRVCVSVLNVARK